jgi:hypothetical protein
MAWYIFKHRDKFTFTFISLALNLDPSYPWGRALHSAIQISRILWIPEVYYRVHKRLRLVLILNQIKPGHIECDREMGDYKSNNN